MVAIDGIAITANAQAFGNAQRRTMTDAKSSYNSFWIRLVEQKHHEQQLCNSDQGSIQTMLAEQRQDRWNVSREQIQTTITTNRSKISESWQTKDQERHNHTTISTNDRRNLIIEDINNHIILLQKEDIEGQTLVDSSNDSASNAEQRFERSNGTVNEKRNENQPEAQELQTKREMD